MSSWQIFLEGKILGVTNDCLLGACVRTDPDQVFTGQVPLDQPVELEVLPRALLAELGLAKILIGSSGASQFLLVLPEESRESAEAFLSAAAKEIATLSAGALKLSWSVTENLGDWSDVRRRLDEKLDRGRARSCCGNRCGVIRGSSSRSRIPRSRSTFTGQLGFSLRDAGSVGWSPETPGRILTTGGKTYLAVDQFHRSDPFRPPRGAQRRWQRADLHRRSCGPIQRSSDLGRTSRRRRQLRDSHSARPNY